MLAIGGADGSSVQIFAIARGRRLPGGESEEKGKLAEKKGEARIVYELIRGLTTASIRDIVPTACGVGSSVKMAPCVSVSFSHGGFTLAVAMF